MFIKQKLVTLYGSVRMAISPVMGDIEGDSVGEFNRKKVIGER
jgi:hypothetical protein